MLLILNGSFFLNGQMLYTYAVLCIAILGAGFALAFLVRESIMNKTWMADHQKSISGLVFEIESKRVSEEILKKELSAKTRALTMLLLYLILKNQLLGMIRNEILKFTKISDDSIASSLSKLSAKVTMSINIEKNLDFLKANFEVFNSDFLDRLSAKYSNLTPSELKLCSLLKNKINSREIAHSLEISRDSAKIAKHRLKRKLGLSTEENLDEFLQLFDATHPGSQEQVDESIFTQ